MTMIYDVIAKRHSTSSSPNCVLYYDEDRDTSIKYMRDYAKKNGFTIYDKDGRFSIADIILRERTATGEEISVTPYRGLFDIFGNRIKSNVN